MVRVLVGMYQYTLVDAAGVAAANRFLTLLNPTGSGISVAIKKVDYQAYAVAATIAKVSKRISLITAHAAGSDVGAASIAKCLSTYANPASQLKISNPTTTPAVPAPDIKAFPPAVVITAAGAYPSPEIDLNPREEIEEIVLAPGEGVAIHQTGTGDTDETMNIRVLWEEFTGS